MATLFAYSVTGAGLAVLWWIWFRTVVTLRWWAFVLLAVLAANAPDLDGITGEWVEAGIAANHDTGGASNATDEDLSGFALMMSSGGVLHSALAAAVLGLLINGICFRQTAKRSMCLFLSFWIFWTCVVLANGVEDAFTDGSDGVMFMAPFSTRRMFAPVQPILGDKAAFLGGLVDRPDVLLSEAVWVAAPVLILVVTGACGRCGGRLIGWRDGMYAKFEDDDDDDGNGAGGGTGRRRNSLEMDFRAGGQSDSGSGNGGGLVFAIGDSDSEEDVDVFLGASPPSPRQTDAEAGRGLAGSAGGGFSILPPPPVRTVRSSAAKPAVGSPAPAAEGLAVAPTTPVSGGGTGGIDDVFGSAPAATTGTTGAAAPALATPLLVDIAPVTPTTDLLGVFGTGAGGEGSGESEEDLDLF